MFNHYQIVISIMTMINTISIIFTRVIQISTTSCFCNSRLVYNFLRLCWFWFRHVVLLHYSGAILSAMASQIPGVSIVYSTFGSGADQRIHQSSASLAFVREFPDFRWIPRTHDQILRTIEISIILSETTSQNASNAEKIHLKAPSWNRMWMIMKWYT